MRYITENIILSAIHEGKPDMNEFFYPLLKELKYIFNKGGIQIKRDGQLFNFIPFLLQFNADLPAKSDVQNMKNHNGYFGCGYCLHPGQLTKGEKNSVVRFVRTQESIPTRTHTNTIEIYSKLVLSNEIKTNKIYKGIKGISCMIAAQHFDLIHSYSIDYMHAVLLGVTKKLLSLWLDGKNHKEVYFISKKRQVVLNNRIMQIKAPTEITRGPRSLDERGDFKANEYRSLLLYYLRYSLNGLLPEKYIKHYRLLSSSIYLLLKENVSQSDICR